MKIWINKAVGSYLAGLAVVAARNEFEAHGVLTQKDNWYNSYFKFENWTCVEQSVVDSEEPYMIAIECHEG